jgi:hypothetical protein
MANKKELSTEDLKAIIADLLTPAVIVIVAQETWACAFCGNGVNWNSNQQIDHDPACRAIMAAAAIGFELTPLYSEPQD